MTGSRPGLNDICGRLAGPCGWKLVYIADDKRGRIIGKSLQQRLHRHDVDHRGFVDDQELAGDRVFVVLFESVS